MADLQRLSQALKAAHEAGDTQAAERLARELRQAQGPSIMDQTVEPERQITQREAEISGLRQGGTMGFGSEVMAGLGARADRAYEGLRGIGVPEGIARPLGAAGSLFMPSTEGDGYEGLRDAYTDELDMAREQWPATAYGMEIGGGITSGAGIGRLSAPLLRQATSRTGRVAGYSGIGAAEGAIYGAGENEGDRIGGAQVGGVVGGVAGPAGAGVGNVLGWTGGALRRIFMEPGSYAAENAHRTIGKLAKDEGVTADQVMDWLNQNPGMTLADFSDRFRNTMVEATGHATREERTIAQGMYRVRNEGAGGRLEEATDGILGTTGRTFRGTVEELKLDRGKIGDEQYRAIFEGAPEFNAAELGEEAEALLQRPSIKRALKLARKSALDEGQPIPGGKPAADAAEAAAEEADELAGTTWEQLHMAQTELQDMIGVAVRAGKNGKARRLIGLRQEVQSLLDNSLPGYNAARAEYATTHQIERAARQGRELFRGQTTFEELDDIAGLQGDEMRAFVVGAKDAIRQRIRDSGDSAVSGVLNSSQRHRLRAVLGDEEAKELFSVFDAEREAGLSGVLTERARARTAEPRPTVSGDVGMAKTNPVLVLTRAIARALDNADNMTPETADKLLKLLARAKSSRSPQETAAIRTALEGIAPGSFGWAGAAGATYGGSSTGILEEN